MRWHHGLIRCCPELLILSAGRLSHLLSHLLQAGAWLQFDMAAGKVPSAQLQSWSGVAWSQADTGAGPAHKLPPLKRAAGSPEANGSGGADASSGVNGSGGAIGSEAINGAANGGAAAEADGKAASPPWAPQPGFGAGASSASAAKPGGASAAGKPGTPQAAPTSSASSGGKSGAAAAGGGSGAPSSAPLPGGDTGMSGFTAQAMLEAHYCVNGAFLLEQTILQVPCTLLTLPPLHCAVGLTRSKRCRWGSCDDFSRKPIRV